MTTTLHVTKDTEVNKTREEKLGEEPRRTHDSPGNSTTRGTLQVRTDKPKYGTSGTSGKNGGEKEHSALETTMHWSPTKQAGQKRNLAAIETDEESETSSGGEEEEESSWERCGDRCELEVGDISKQRSDIQNKDAGQLALEARGSGRRRGPGGPSHKKCS